MSEEEFGQAAALFAARNYTEALQQYLALAARHNVTDEVRVRAYNNASACHASLRDYTAALTMARHALALRPDHVRALLRAATACEGLRSYDEAVAYVTRAQQRSKDGGSISSGDGALPHVDYDAMLARLGSLRDAAASRRTAAADRRDESGGTTATTATTATMAEAATHDRFYFHKSVQKGSAAAAAGNYSEALRSFTKALDRVDAVACTAREHATLLCNRSAAHLHLGDVAASAADAARAIDVDATYARAHYRHACALYKQRRYRDTAAALRCALQYDAAHTQAQALLRDVDALAREEEKTAAEKAADTARHVAELREQQREAAAAAAAAATTTMLPRGNKYVNGYVCCTYCNEAGHTRAECPLLLRHRHKRPRTDAAC